MTNYSSDQFYKFPSYEGGGKSTNRNYNDNPNFNYPSNVTNPLGTRGAEPIQRGFIRGIYPAVLGKQQVSGANTVKQRRLFFQFNPTTLDRTVEMNMSMLNPLLQDPQNLLQPVPGSSSFSFDILFNRESEVVTNRYTNSAGNRRNSTPITDSLDAYGTNTQPDDVSTLGVLADLYILDSIIGQSITPDMVDFLKSYWNNASNLSQSTYTAGDGSASFSFNDTAFQTTVQKNYGNSAFLSPLPVRIVFSSLFMVEGFVTSSSVQFVKFTRNYVPTICKVTLSVRALYIGFAREKAYLTDALETAVSDMVETNKKDKLLETTMKNLLRNVYLRYAPNPYTSSAVSGFIFSPSFEADTDKYSNEVISDTLLPEPGLVSQGDAFSTFKAWWDTSRYQYNLVYGGLLYSGVTKSFKDEVEKNGVTWSFSSRLEINKNLNFSNPNEPTGGELLFSGDFSYKKRSGGDIDEQTIGNNANSKIWTSYGTASNNVDNWAIKKPVRTAESVSQYDKITFSIITDYTLNYTNSTGAATTTRQVRKDHTIIAGSSSDWNKIKQYTPIWDMWTRTGGQSTVVPGS